MGSNLLGCSSFPVVIISVMLLSIVVFAGPSLVLAHCQHFGSSADKLIIVVVLLIDYICLFSLGSTGNLVMVFVRVCYQG